MRKLFTAISLFALLLTGCDTPNEPTTPAYTLALTSEKSITFDETGGSGEITYTLTEVVSEATRTDAALPTATCEAEWITDLTVGDSITFNVAPMEYTAEDRYTVVFVSYDNQSFSVNILQQSTRPDYDVEFFATHLNGAYYGKVGSPDFNYTITLSDKGVPGRGQFYYNSHAYNIDIFSDVSCGFSCEPQRVPNGVYKFDGRNRGEAGTFMANFDYTYYTELSDSSQTFYSIIDGSIVVTDNHIEASLRTDDGQWHHVVYTGDLTLTYDYIKDIKRPYTRLAEDFNFEYKNAYLHTYYRGDHLGLGYDVWYVDMCPTVMPMNGTYMMLTVMVDKAKGGYTRDAFLGEYKVAQKGAESYANTFVAGDLLNGYEVIYSWCLTCENSMISNAWGGPIVDGTIKIELIDGYYVVSFDCVDDAGHKIVGSYSCMHDGYINQNPNNPDEQLK